MDGSDFVTLVFHMYYSYVVLFRVEKSRVKKEKFLQENTVYFGYTMTSQFF